MKPSYFTDIKRYVIIITNIVLYIDAYYIAHVMILSIVVYIIYSMFSEKI